MCGELCSNTAADLAGLAHGLLLPTANTLRRGLSLFWANTEQLFGFPRDGTGCTADYCDTRWRLLLVADSWARRGFPSA